VLDIRGTEHQGRFDDELWPFAPGARRMLFTTDKGFAGHRDEQATSVSVIAPPSDGATYSR
jgi:hypothetical protein